VGRKSQKNEPELIDPGSVATGFLADCLGLTAAQVSRLGAARIIKTNGHRGKYSLTDAIPQYVSSLRGTGEANAKAKLAVQQERKLRLLNDKEAGSLVKISDAAEAFRQFWLVYRAGINALPRRLAQQLSNEVDPSKIQRLLDDEFAELYRAMEGVLSEHFAKDGYQLSFDAAGDSGSGTAPKRNARSVGRRKKGAATRKRRAGKVAK